MTEVVYVIGSPHGGLVKIGRSVDVDRRLATIQRMSPVPLAVLFKTEGGTQLERALHGYFQSYRTHGEWFDFGQADPIPMVTAALTKALPRPYGNTPLRNIRVAAPIWAQPRREPKPRRPDLTDVLVSYLKDYGAGWEAPRTRPTTTPPPDLTRASGNTFGAPAHGSRPRNSTHPNATASATTFRVIEYVAKPSPSRPLNRSSIVNSWPGGIASSTSQTDSRRRS